MQDLTWDEFIEIGKDVTEKTGTPMIVEIANNKTTLVRAMMQSCGLWYYDQNGDINITNNEALKAAFETILKMKEAGILYEAESTEGRAAALNNGQVASVESSSYPQICQYFQLCKCVQRWRLQLVCTGKLCKQRRSHQIPSGCMAGKHRFL